MNFSKYAVLALAGLLAATFTFDADAQRRLGGGLNMGRKAPQLQQRQATPPQPAQQAPQAAPAQQPNAAAAAKGAPAAAAARPASPMRNMLVGAAAGLGLMALAHALGFGETMATFMLIALIAAAALMLFGVLARRNAAAAGAPPAYRPAGAAPAGAAPRPPLSAVPQPAAGPGRPGSAMDEFFGGRPAAPAAGGAPAAWDVPEGFDTAGFLARAKDYYAQLQAAWDDGDLARLQEFTTDEMFIALTHELRTRAGRTRTEIVSLDAKLLGIEPSRGDYLASVRFTGELKVDGETETVDEVWNLAKPVSGNHGWLLAGIQQLS